MEQTKQITRSNGRSYTIRSNRDRFFFPAEWIKFYDCLRKKQQKTFDCLLNIGARINEARHLQKQDCDFINKRIVLRVTKVKAKKGEKNPRPRNISVSTEFNKRLKKYFAGKTEEDYIGILSTPAANTAMKVALRKA